MYVYIYIATVVYCTWCVNVFWLANLEYLCGSFGCSIVLCPEAKVILVVFTVHVFVNGL